MKHSVSIALAAAFASACASADALSQAAATAGASAGISEEEAALPQFWQGKVAAGFDTASGNTEEDGASVHLEAKKLHGDWVVLATGDGAWKQTEVDGEDHDTESNAKAEVNVKRRLGGYFVYGDLMGLHDGVAGVKYRTAESVGLGTFLVDEETLKFSVEAGLAYVQEKLDGTQSDDYLAWRVAERADYVPVWAEGVSFYEQASVLADFDESDRWTADFETGIDIPMFAGLSTTLKAVVAHNHMPAEGKEKTDRRLLAQVGYNF